MCGIAGSNNKERAFTLYQSNLNRGYYSSGGIIVDNNSNWTTHKREGQFERPINGSVGQYYLYHSRGPTTETKEYNPTNNHPFFYGDWIVSHNGIISNFKTLCEKYFPGDNFEGKTDSCIIPRLLSIKPTITEALEELEGIFALWMFNRNTKRCYITRSASTLFGNTLTGDFSSTAFNGSTALKEGVVYSITNYNCIIEENTHKTKSPYFIL
jgi:glucosamine 6-phosphate synthetase-like amidotransferase/phosphosugar isomerase protein